MINKPIKIYNEDNLSYEIIGEMIERMNKKDAFNKVPLSIDKYDGKLFSVKVVNKQTKKEYLVQGRLQNSKTQYNLYITQKRLEW